MKIKKRTLIIVVVSLITILIGVVFTGGIFMGRKMNTRIVHVNLEYVEPEPLPDRVHKYAFIEPVMSDFIEDLCIEVDYDSDLVVAHLMVENPEMDWKAIHVNSNGTLDLGGFQLNDCYLYTTFLPAYWDLDVEFDPFNPKHNAYVAILHMKHLQDTLKIQSDAIAAYNCGAGRVMSGEIPESTKIYVQRVTNYYMLLKGSHNNE